MVTAPTPSIQVPQLSLQIVVLPLGFTILSQLHVELCRQGLHLFALLTHCSLIPPVQIIFFASDRINVQPSCKFDNYLGDSFRFKAMRINHVGAMWMPATHRRPQPIPAAGTADRQPLVLVDVLVKS